MRASLDARVQVRACRRSTSNAGPAGGCTHASCGSAGAVSLLACALGLNFIRGVFSPTWLRDSAWSGSDFEAFLVKRSKAFVAVAMLTRDELLCSSDPWSMLRVRATAEALLLARLAAAISLPIFSQVQNAHLLRLQRA